MERNATNMSNLFTLDLLRFGAAFLVMYYHFYAAFPFAHDGPIAYQLGGLSLPTQPPPLSPYGWIGVEIFFVISGYVIAMSTQSGSAIDFVVKRFLRLWPTAFICATLTAIALILSGFHNELLFTAWIHSATLFAMEPQIDPSYWTLGIEISFYAIVALILISSKRPDKLLLLAVAIGCASLIFNINVDTAATLDRKNQLLQLPFGCFFALGIAVFHWHMNIGRKLSCWLIPLCLFGCFFSIWHHSIDRASFAPTPISVVTAYIIFIVGLIVIMTAPAAQKRWGSRVNKKITSTLGLMTYPFYLLHQVIGAIIIGTFMRGGISFYSASIIVAIIVTALSFMLVRYVEPSVRGKLKGWIIAGRSDASSARLVG